MAIDSNDLSDYLIQNCNQEAINLPNNEVIVSFSEAY